MNPILFYCYDAYCGWCYGFSAVIKRIAQAYPSLQIEVISGGMILPDPPIHISATAGYILSAYKTVEEYSGVKFGADYLWHIQNPDLSDWYPHSEKPAIALCIFKEIYPDRQVEFACDLQNALHYDGRDLTDDEAYRHLLEKYSIQPELFYTLLKQESYQAKAFEEFALVKKLQVTGYPCILIQISANKFHILTRGFAPYESVKKALDGLLKENPLFL